MEVKIYRAQRSAMQSGRANEKEWIAEFVRTQALAPEALMGWATMQDTTRQVKLRFASEEQAIAWAKSQGFSYALSRPPVRRSPPKTYDANFRANRLLRWTH